MKMTLEYDETERYEHEVACKALDILILVDDIDQELRSALKHESGAFAKMDEDTMESVRAWIWEERTKRNIPELT
jgi:hypothetical protein